MNTIPWRIGIVPIPIYVILIALLAGFTYTGDIKGDVSTMIAVLAIGGFTCAEIGKRTPVLRNIGAAAIFATFVPSALAYYKLLPPQIDLIQELVDLVLMKPPRAEGVGGDRRHAASFRRVGSVADTVAGAILAGLTSRTATTAPTSSKPVSA